MCVDSSLEHTWIEGHFHQWPHHLMSRTSPSGRLSGRVAIAQTLKQDFHTLTFVPCFSFFVRLLLLSAELPQRNASRNASKWFHSSAAEGKTKRFFFLLRYLPETTCSFKAPTACKHNAACKCVLLHAWWKRRLHLRWVVWFSAKLTGKRHENTSLQLFPVYVDVKL